MPLLPLLLAGCGALDAEGAPRVEAHRCAAGYYPQNSRTGCLEALAAGYEVIEFDLVLTEDEIPVVMHDPWLDPLRCTTADGAALSETELILVKDLTWDELSTGYLCGGPPDPDWPDAVQIAETIMAWDELRIALYAHPDVTAHIDVKWEDPYTIDAATFAERVMGPWWAEAAPNPYYVSGYDGFIPAVEAYGAEQGEDPVTSVTWPYFPSEGSDIATALRSEFAQAAGVTELVDVAEAAHADSVNVAWQVADRRKVEAALDAGVPVQLWTLNDADQLGAFGKWPVEALITDVPAEAP